MNFAERLQDRNNHFNLIRLAAALVVLGAHGGTMLDVAFFAEPVIHSYGIFIGTVAVHVFFIVSGFLVTGSLFNRGSLTAFVWARFLRIFPGLWAMLLITVFGVGLAMTRLSAADYLTSLEVYRYFGRCATVVTGMAWSLPGVFEENILPNKVNGSLWTIAVEWRLYEYLAMSWLLLAVVAKYRKNYRKSVIRVAFPLVALALFAYIAAGHRDDGGAANAFLFFAGSTIYLWGDRIPVRLATAPALAAVLALALLDRNAFYFVYLLVLPPILLTLAYAPGRTALRFNAYGDYSYGVYIYAFPIQQTLIALYPGISWLTLTLASAILSLSMAVLSWRYVESPALAHKDMFAAATTRWFAAMRSRFMQVWRRRDAFIAGTSERDGRPSPQGFARSPATAEKPVPSRAKP
jgi:peptidoglycan/LPS O-acetylase OafA/YrhL